MIISGGVNIYPQEIENHLITHPPWPTSPWSARPMPIWAKWPWR
jgi:acyl-CoA synthetase (AMP-forming)/AMP-acid ligase II